MDSKWRQTIVDRLRERNKRENDSFHDIVTSSKTNNIICFCFSQSSQ